MQIDFGEDAVGGGLIPEGLYIFQVEDLEVKESKKDPSSRYLNFKCRAVQPEGFEKHLPVWHMSSLLPQSRWKLKADLEAITGEDWSQDGMDLDPRAIVGCLFQGVVIHEIYENKPNAKFKDLFRYDAS